MRHRKGFTLIELIVVVIVLGVLLAIVVPRLTVSTDDANAKMLAKAAKDIRDAVVIGKVKCLGTLNTAAGDVGADTQALLNALASSNCQVLSQNAYEVDSDGYAKVKDFGIQTDFQNANNVLVMVVNCKGSDSICGKVREQLNDMYGGGACPNAPASGVLTCNLPV